MNKGSFYANTILSPTSLIKRTIIIIPKSKILLIFLLISLFSCSSENQTKISGEKEIEAVQPLNLSETQFPYAFFTDSQKILNNSESTVIMDKLVNYIDATPEGSSIFLSIYLFDYKPVINALKRSHSRNVKLHIMADMSDRSSNNGTLNEFRNLNEGIEIVEIKNDASSIAINHNKFVLFSEVVTINGTVKNVIFQTSHNFIRDGMKKIQDAVILSNSGLYKAYYENWQDMRNLSDKGMKNYLYTEYINPSENIRANFYPKRKNGASYGEDTVIEMLDNITQPEATTIKIGMSDWSDSRKLIIDKLDELLMKGAKIEIITKSGKGPEINNGLKSLEIKGAYVKMFNMGNAGVPKINLHFKVMMIDGVINGEKSNLIMTGTQNFTNNAIWNNNEISLIFYNHAFYDKYENYFKELKKLPGIEIPD